ncbi:MAG: hypothetical protein K1X89_16135 [Myxococcaceae bacterium]|nr:hypothetical protein [Myxococcaceae bacterium]
MTAALLLSLLLSAPAGDVETEVERGNALIRNLQEEKALEVLEPLASSAATPAMLRARAAVYAGIARLNLGQESEARRWFAAALELDRGASLPDWCSRRVQGVFDKVRAQAPRPESSPPPPALVPQPAPANALAAAPVVATEAPVVTHRLAIGLGIAAAAAAIASGAMFLAWNANYRGAIDEPQALAAQRLQQRSAMFWGLGLLGAFGTGALGLGAGLSLLF